MSSIDTMIAGIDPGHSSDQKVRPKVWWNTRQIALDQKDRNLYVRLTIKELAVYAVFFVLLFASCSSLYSYSTFVVNKEVASLFVESSFALYTDDNDVSMKFADIITMEHFWRYFYTVLCEKLYEIPVGSDKESGSEILFENKFLYRPRARQVRVEEGHCEIRNQFKGLFKECYVPYNIKYEDKTNFGPENGTPWIYSQDSETQSVYYEGEMAYYGAGGYYFDFPKDKKDAKSLINDLEKNTWLNRATRAVFVDFAIYNCNINVVCVVKLVFEFPASGGIVPSSSFRTVKLYRYAVADSLWTLMAFLSVTVFVVYFTIEELFELVYFRLDYFTVFWNVVDFIIVILGWCIIVVGIVIAFEEPSSKLENVAAKEGSKFFEFLIDRHENLMRLMAYVFFLACVKIVKYTDLSRSMTAVYLTVGRCFKVVAGYLVIMVIIVAAFAILGYCAFGTQVKGFSTVNDSLLSSIRILMRDFDFETLERADQAFTTLFFVSFSCIVIFILMTMLIAIVFHAYFDVNVEELLSDRKIYVWDKISMFIDGILQKIGMKDWAERRRNKRKENELSRQIPYQDVYKTLKRCHFTDSEVEKILDNYNIKPQQTVHEDEARELFRDVLENKATTSKVDAGATVSDTSDIDWLIKRVDLIEKSMDAVHNKCDVIIARLDAIRVQTPPNYAEQTEDNS